MAACKSPRNSRPVVITALLLAATLSLLSQTAVAPQGKDQIVFKNGEKLIGQLQRSTGDTVIFKSDMAGSVTVKWSDIREIHTTGMFAIVEKNTKLEDRQQDGQVPQGRVSVVDGSIIVDQPSSASIKLPLSTTADIIDQSTFDRVVLHHPNLIQNWKGTATVGLAVVAATQESQTYTSAVSFVRNVPGESWMDPETRTSASFNSAYGQITQPFTPTVKTSIFHAVGERDKYFSPRLFSFFNLQFDHDFSQGLDLQQVYSTGVGFSVIREKNEQLDLRAALGYEKQQFEDASQNQNLLGSIFSESYNRILPKATLHQDLSVTPSWSNLHAYSATGNLTLTIPVVRRFSFTTGLSDTFLNNPSPNFRKNSFQFSSGITYTVK